MNNFGVIELASAKVTHTPGWAYVPDTSSIINVASLPSNPRKRAARGGGGSNLSVADVSARQVTKAHKDLEALERDSHRETNIPIPQKSGAGNSSKSQTKHTPNVRKIVQSQKTFANHLDDYQALLALEQSNPASAALNPFSLVAQPTTRSSSPEPSAAGSSKRAAAGSSKSTAPNKRKKGGALASTSKRTSSSTFDKKGKGSRGKMEEPEKHGEPLEDVEMTCCALEQTSVQDETRRRYGQQDRPQLDQAPHSQSYTPDSKFLPPYPKPPPIRHPGDNDPLLISAVPPFPTDEELRALMTAAPFGYLEARARWDYDVDSGPQYPKRTFCVMCGYWGKLRCTKCGARVCALNCLEVHKEECLTRYGF